MPYILAARGQSEVIVHHFLKLRSPIAKRRSKMQSKRIALALLVAVWTIGVSDAVATNVQILDECDPATFNAVGLGVICEVGFDGRVTFPELASLLSPAAFGHPAWRFDAPFLVIQPNQQIRV